MIQGGGWTNAGTIEASGGEAVLMGSWTSTGTIEASGANVDLEGTWTNTGAIALSGGTIYLLGAGSLAPAAAGGSGSVFFEGTLNNAGTTLALDDSSLSYLFEGGTIDGGTVSTSSGATLGWHGRGRHTGGCDARRHA